MTEQVCDIAECTFPQTGTCMKSYAPEECPSHKAALAKLHGAGAVSQISEAGVGEELADSDLAELVGEAVLASPVEKPSLPRTGTLGPNEVNELMSCRYVNLIGILGLPNAGKTACIASLYLLLANDSLRGFTYSDSRTLMALEEISSGTRRWNDGDAPKDMTAHTELADDRRAGFLHLRLKRSADGRKFDMLLPDLPGEWSRGLINNGDGARFSFLKSAEVIWLMVNGRDFLNAGTRELAIYRFTNLVERLAPILLTPRPRIILVATWHDMGELPTPALRRMQDFGKDFGFNIEYAPIASFSANEVPPGFGLAELVEKTLSVPERREPVWPLNLGPRSDRSFLNFGVHP